ncbi:MAG: gas vesicle protein [Proteobacteria bacterium]|nr:gas vesicle protein [Pseudomonadota bacterium]
MSSSHRISHATDSSTLADVLERVLDQGIVIAGDIRVKLVDIELLTIQIRLVICSVDKAIEMGMDWWAKNPNFSSLAGQTCAGDEGRAIAAASRVAELSDPGPASQAPSMSQAQKQQRIAQLQAELARLNT